MTKKLSECSPEEAERLRAQVRKQNARYSSTEAGRATRRRCNRNYYERHRERLLAGMTAYAATDEGRLAHLEATKRWQQRNKEKLRAHRKAHYALKVGKIERKPCEACGAKAEMHHDDYSKPLEVRWLCRQHHKDQHKET